MFLYLGPGIDGGIIATVIGILVSFFLAVLALVWLPLKKLFAKVKAKIAANKQNEKD